mmetsp:Transcript_11659/g.22054  ORF Transcript_11659/g.22054 Transcript_11659/m.22054 type:complete len:217 (-) Transcript_11659:565-1215(-)
MTVLLMLLLLLTIFLKLFFLLQHPPPTHSTPIIRQIPRRHSGAHENQLQILSFLQQVLQRNHQKLRVLITLVDLVHDQMGILRQSIGASSSIICYSNLIVATISIVRMQSFHQHSGRAKQQLRFFRVASVETDRVAHGLTSVLATFGRHAFRERNGADATRLRDKYIARGTHLRVVQEELWHLGRFSTSSIPSKNHHLILLISQHITNIIRVTKCR